MINKRLAFCIIVFVSMHLAGCSLTSPDETLHLPTHTPSPSVILSPSPEFSASTLAPSSVPPTRTPGPTYTPMPTPAPTRTADEERAYVREMLATNGGCELPCWWGITPGETTWQTVQDQFGLYYGQGQVQPDGTVYHDGPTYGLSPGRFFDYYIKHTFVEKGGIVQSIQVVGSLLYRDTSEHFAQDWNRYSVDQILTRHGKPSGVNFRFVPPTEPGASPYYDLALVYEHLGFFINYEGLAIYDPPTMQACPRLNEVTLLVLRLQSPLSSEPVLEPQGECPFPTLREAIGMDVRTFYETFGNADSDVCLESPADMW